MINLLNPCALNHQAYLVLAGEDESGLYIRSPCHANRVIRTIAERAG